MAFALACATLGFGDPAFGSTLTLDLNGVAGEVYSETAEGAVAVPDISVDFGDAFKLTGWNTRRNGTGTSYKAGELVSGDVTLYAQWQSGFMLVQRNNFELGKNIALAEGVPQGRRKAQDYEKLGAAIQAAKTVYADERAEQADVDAALKSLKSAVAAYEKAYKNRDFYNALTSEAAFSQPVDGEEALGESLAATFEEDGLLP